MNTFYSLIVFLSSFSYAMGVAPLHSIFEWQECFGLDILYYDKGCCDELEKSLDTNMKCLDNVPKLKNYDVLQISLNETIRNLTKCEIEATNCTNNVTFAELHNLTRDFNYFHEKIIQANINGIQQGSENLRLAVGACINPTTHLIESKVTSYRNVTNCTETTTCTVTQVPFTHVRGLNVTSYRNVTNCTGTENINCTVTQVPNTHLLESNVTSYRNVTNCTTVNITCKVTQVPESVCPDGTSFEPVLSNITFKTLFVEDGALIKASKGNFIYLQQNKGENNSINVNFLKINQMNGTLSVLGNASNVSFSSNVTLDFVQLNVTATELNVLSGQDKYNMPTGKDLNLLKGIDVTADEMGTMKNVTSALNRTYFEQLIGLNIEVGDLNVMKGHHENLTKGELEKLLNLQVPSGTLNLLKGLEATAAEMNDLKSVSITNEQANILHNVDPDLGFEELNLLLQLDINLLDLNVLKRGFIVREDDGMPNDANVMTEDECQIYANNFAGSAMVVYDRDDYQKGCWSKFTRTGNILYFYFNKDMTSSKPCKTGGYKCIERKPMPSVEVYNLLPGLTVDATQLNIFKDARGTVSQDLNKLVGLIVPSKEINVLEGVTSSLSSNELNMLKNLQVNSNEINVLKDVDHRLNATNNLNQLVGLLSNASKMNTLVGVGKFAALTSGDAPHIMSREECDAYVLEVGGVFRAEGSYAVEAQGCIVKMDSSNANGLDIGNIWYNTKATGKPCGAGQYACVIKNRTIPFNLLKDLESKAAELNIMDGVDVALQTQTLDLLIGLDLQDPYKGYCSTSDRLTEETCEYDVIETGKSDLSLNAAGCEVFAKKFDYLWTVATTLGDGKPSGCVVYNDGVDTVIYNKDATSSLLCSNDNKCIQRSAYDWTADYENDLNILKGINHQLSKNELDKLKGLKTPASSWNALENIEVSELQLLHEKAPLYSEEAGQLYSGSSCSDTNDCQTKCSADLECVGYSVKSGVYTFGNLPTQDAAATGYTKHFGISEPDKLVSTSADGGTTFAKNVQVQGNVSVPDGKLLLNGASVTVQTVQLNDLKLVDHLQATTTEINALDDIITTPAKLNLMTNYTGSTEDLNRLADITPGISASNKVLTTSETHGLVTVAGDVDIKNVSVSLNGLTMQDGAITSTSAEINVLHDISPKLTVEEVNRLDVSQKGIAEAGKALVTSHTDNITMFEAEIDTKLLLKKHKLYIDKTLVKADASELNTLVGINEGLDAAEYHVMDGVVSSTNDLNVVLGVNSSAVSSGDIQMMAGSSSGSNSASRVVTKGDNIALNHVNATLVDSVLHKINIGDTTVTVSADELNLLTGVNSSMSSNDWDKLIGLRASVAELNLLYGATIDVKDVNALLNDVIMLDNSKNVKMDSLRIRDTLEVALNQLFMEAPTFFNPSSRQICSATEAADPNSGCVTYEHKLKVRANATELNKIQTLSTTEDLNKLAGVVASQEELELMKGVLVDVHDINALVNDTFVMDTLKNIAFDSLKVHDELKAATFAIDEIGVKATSTEINRMQTLSSTEDLNKLAGVVASQDELEIMKDVTVDVNDINALLDDAPMLGASKNISFDSLKVRDETKIDNLVVEKIAVEATSAEINRMQTVSSTEDLNKLTGVLASQEELKKMVNITASTDDLNMLTSAYMVRTDNSSNIHVPNATIETLNTTTLMLDGDEVFSTVVEINKVGSIGLSTEDLNKMHGVVSTTDELGVLHGVTISTEDLNMLKNRVILTSNDTIYFHGNTTGKNMSFTVFKLKGRQVTATSFLLINNITARIEKLNVMKNVSASAEQINKVKTNATIVDLNMLAEKLVVVLEENTLRTQNIKAEESTLFLNVLQIGDLSISTRASEINRVKDFVDKEHLEKIHNVTSSSQELSIMDGAVASTNDLNLLQAKKVHACNDPTVGLEKDCKGCSDSLMELFECESSCNVELCSVPGRVTELTCGTCSDSHIILSTNCTLCSSGNPSSDTVVKCQYPLQTRRAATLGQAHTKELCLQAHAAYGGVASNFLDYTFTTQETADTQYKGCSIGIQNGTVFTAFSPSSKKSCAKAISGNTKSCVEFTGHIFYDRTWTKGTWANYTKEQCLRNGICNDPLKTTEEQCVSCSDPSKTTATTCIGTCSDPQYTTKEDCEGYRVETSGLYANYNDQQMVHEKECRTACIALGASFGGVIATEDKPFGCVKTSTDCVFNMLLSDTLCSTENQCIQNDVWTERIWSTVGGAPLQWTPYEWIERFELQWEEKQDESSRRILSSHNGVATVHGQAVLPSSKTLRVNDTIKIGNVAITSTWQELNTMENVDLDVDALNILDGILSTTANLNVMHGVNASTKDINLVTSRNFHCSDDRMVGGFEVFNTRDLCTGLYEVLEGNNSNSDVTLNECREYAERIGATFTDESKKCSDTSLLNKESCLSQGLCADENGTIGGGFNFTSSGRAACESQSVCGTPTYTEQCVFHNAYTYADKSFCSQELKGTVINNTRMCKDIIGSVLLSSISVASSDYESQAAFEACANYQYAANNKTVSISMTNQWCIACSSEDLHDTAVAKTYKVGHINDSYECTNVYMHSWTLTGECSDHAYNNHPEGCLGVGTCDDGKGNVGNGNAYFNDPDGCRAATDCGPPIGSDPCFFTPKNNWTGTLPNKPKGCYKEIFSEISASLVGLGSVVHFNPIAHVSSSGEQCGEKIPHEKLSITHEEPVYNFVRNGQTRESALENIVDLNITEEECRSIRDEYMPSASFTVSTNENGPRGCVKLASGSQFFYRANNVHDQTGCVANNLMCSYAGKDATTELCGICSLGSSFLTEDHCGTCSDSSKDTETTCVDTCYNYAGSTKVFSGNTCFNVTDCTQKCTDSSTCEGFTSACSDSSKTTEDTCGTCDIESLTTSTACQAGGQCDIGVPALTAPDTSTWPEYDCSNPQTSGTFKLTTSCTHTGVSVTGDLTIVGQNQDMDNLVTLTKAQGRHFYVDSADETLTLWHVKLTGGDTTFNGGAILVTRGASLNLYYSEVSGNKAAGYNGGGIFVGYDGAQGAKNKVAIYGSIIKNNVAKHAGGIWVGHSDVVNIVNTTIDSNAGDTDNGGLWLIDESVATITNTVISNNRVANTFTATGGGLRVDSSTVTLRQVSFINNRVGINSHSTTTMINAVGLSDTTDLYGTWTTCSDNPCIAAPYTGACSAVDASDSKLGVTCALASDYVPSVDNCGTCSNTSLTSKTTCDADANAIWTPYAFESATWTAGTWNAALGSSYAYGPETAATGGTSEERSVASSCDSVAANKIFDRTWSAETWTPGTLLPAFSPTHVCIKKISEGIYNKTHVSCIKRREWYDRTQTEVIVTDVNGNVAIDSVIMPNLAITNSISFNGGSISHFANINSLLGITASTEELNRFNDYDTLVIADQDGKVTLMDAVTAQELIIHELRLKNLSYVPPRLTIKELNKRCFATRHSVTGKSEEECKAYLMEVKERGVHCVAGDGSTTEAASSEECEQSWMGLGTVTLAEYQPLSTTCSWCFGTTIMNLNDATIFSIAEARYKGVTATGVLNMLQTFSAFDVNWVHILNNAGRGVVLSDEKQKIVLRALSIAGTLTTSSLKVNETLMNHTAFRLLQGIDDIKKLDDYDENILRKLDDVMTSDATTAQLNLAGAICGSCSDFRVKSKALCDGGFCVDDPTLSKADCPGAFIERVWTENDCDSPANLLLQEVVNTLSEETCTKDHSYELLPNGCVDGDNVDGTITKTDCLFTFDNTTEENMPCSTGEVTSYDKCVHTYDTYPGRCSDRSDKTEAECVSFCDSGESLENCGVCSCRRAADISYTYTETTLHYSGTCYEYASSVKVFSGSSCANPVHCEHECSNDITCDGFTSTCSDPSRAGTETDCAVCSNPFFTTEADCVLNVQHIAASEDHTVALLNDGTLKAWGKASYGLSGYENTIQRTSPPSETIDLGTCGNSACTVKQIVIADEHNCAILSDDTLKCWGSNCFGQLGIDDPYCSSLGGDGNDVNYARGDHANEMGDNLPRVDLGTGKKAKQVAVGGKNTCAIILNDNTLKCWGWGKYGQNGYGSTALLTAPPSDTINLGTCGNSACTAKEVAVGNSHICVVLNDDTVKCWGWQYSGKLGNGNGGHGYVTSPPSDTVDLGTCGDSACTAKHISSHNLHTCVILNDDSLKCWGRNNNGELGYGDTNNRGDGANEMGDDLPRVDLGTCGSSACTVKQVSAGELHTCAILNDDSLKCWGRGTYYGLGYGDQNNRGDTGAGQATCDDGYEMGDCLPRVDLGTCGSGACTAKQVAAGDHNTCVVLNDNTLKCWGDNRHGKLGHSGPTTGPSTTTVNVGTVEWSTLSHTYGTEVALSGGTSQARIEVDCTCADANACQVACTADSNCEGYEAMTHNITFTSSTITTNADGARSVYAADLDGDGDMDVLSASKQKIAWYENTDGQGTFSTQKTIAVINSYVVTSVYAADLDGDGDMDVLSTAYDGGNEISSIAWYENDGQGTFSPQNIADVLGAESVYAADIDGDGDMDVLSSSDGGEIAWYDNTDGQGTFTQNTFRTNPNSATHNSAKSVYAADLDGDGDMDVLTASSTLNMGIAWYENTDGQGTFSTLKTISTQVIYAMSVYAADIDGDGDMDVLSASAFDDKIAWYENYGNKTFSALKTITTQADYANSVYAADIDGDGDIDVFSASGVDDKIAWYENTDGQGTFSTQKTITTQADYAYSVYAADIDGDGVLDVLSASKNDDKIAWYKTSPPYTYTYGPSTEGTGQGFKKETSGHADVTCPSYIDGKSTCSNQCEDGGTEEAKCGTCSGSGASSTFDTPVCSHPNVPATPEACSGCLTADIPDDFTSHMPSSCGGSYDCLKDLTKDAEACAAAGHTWLTLTVPDGLSIIDNKAQCVGYCEYDRSKTKEECPTIETYQRSELMKYNSSGACISEEECVSKCNADDNCKGYSQFCSEEEKTHSPCPVYCPTNENLAHYNFGMCGQCSDGVTDNNVTCTNGCGRCNDATITSSADCVGVATDENGASYEREFSLSTGFCTDPSQATEADCVGTVEGMAKTDKGRLCLIDGYKKLHCKETGNWKEIAIGGVVQVSTGAGTTCAVTDNGKLYCFGPTLEDAPQEVTLPEGTAKHVEVSGNGQCATNNNDKLFCWGDQEFSNLGVGSTVGTSVASPLPVGNPAGLDTFTVDKFKVSDFSACAIADATQLALNCQFGKTSHIIPDNSTWPEYDCSNPATSGTYKLTTSCTLSAEVALTGDLTIVGQTQDMDNLVTITAAASSRHFKLDSTNDVLNLLHVHLTRGRGSGHGGSIELYGSAKLNLYYSVISNSVSGQRGGVIYASSAVINIFGCSIRDNQAGWNGGGLNVAHTTLVIINTNFHNNKAGNLWTGGAITISSSSLVIRNSIISGSRAEDGAGIRAEGSGITISESTFTNNVNLGGYAAHDIKLVQASVTLVNTVLDRGNNGGWYQGSISTCSHNPCVHAPYTGACSAVDASNSKKGVTCALATDYEFSVETCGTCSTPSLTSKTTCDTTATWIPYSVATTWTEDYGGKMFCWGKAPFNGLSSDVDVPTKLSLPAGTSGSEQKMLDFDMGISFGSTIPASTASTTASSDIYVSAGQLSAPYYTFTDSDGNAVTALEANTIYTFHRLNGATTHPFAIDHSGAQYSTGSVTNGITGSATITVDTTNVNSLSYKCTSHPSMVGQLSVRTSSTSEMAWSCGIMEDEKLYCWGEEASCEFGKTSHTTPDTSTWTEYTCGNPQTSGTFKISSSCTLNDVVTLDGDLTIIGQTEDMNNLVTITAATGKGHFVGGAHKLTLWYVKVSGATNDGSAISVNPGELSLYYSEVSENIMSGQGSKPIECRNGKVNIYGSSVHSNQAVYLSGIYLNLCDMTIHNSTISNNEATLSFLGSAIYCMCDGDGSCNIIISDTIISDNTASYGAIVQDGGSITLRQVSFINNDPYDFRMMTSGTLVQVNTVYSAPNKMWFDNSNTAALPTCSDNPCVVAPYTGACSAVDASDDTLGVTCALALATDYVPSVETCGTCSDTSLTSKTTCDGDTTATWTPYAYVDAAINEVPLPTGRKASKVSVGSQHACTLLDDQKVYCWGQDNYHGDGSASNAFSSSIGTAVTMPGSSSLLDLKAGEQQNCMRFDDKKVYCWGKQYAADSETLVPSLETNVLWYTHPLGQCGICPTNATITDSASCPLWIDSSLTYETRSWTSDLKGGKVWAYGEGTPLESSFHESKKRFKREYIDRTWTPKEWTEASWEDSSTELEWQLTSEDCSDFETLLSGKCVRTCDLNTYRNAKICGRCSDASKHTADTCISTCENGATEDACGYCSDNTVVLASACVGQYCLDDPSKTTQETCGASWGDRVWTNFGFITRTWAHLDCTENAIESVEICGTCSDTDKVTESSCDASQWTSQTIDKTWQSVVSYNGTTATINAEDIAKAECSQSDTCEGIQLENNVWKYGPESRCTTIENCQSLRDIQETKERHTTGNTYVETVHFTALASQEAAQVACAESDTCDTVLELDDGGFATKDTGVVSFQSLISIETAGSNGHSEYTNDFKLVDMDNDGDLDILSAHKDTNSISWSKNDNGAFSTTYDVSTSANGATSVHAGDFDGDGDVDVVASHGQYLSWYKNDGNTFTSQTLSFTNQVGPEGAYAADVDNDGDLDILAVHPLNNKIYWFENAQGNFGTTFIPRDLTSNVNGPKSVFAADVDGDGYLDILCANSGDNEVAWFKNNGDQPATFTTKNSIFANAVGVLSVYAVDVDGDGDMDVLSASTDDDTIAWYENDGQGTFNGQKTLTTQADGAAHVYAADVDGDGDIDVFSASHDDNKVAWYENLDGKGTFGAQNVLGSVTNANRVYAGDINGDGSMDVVAQSYRQTTSDKNKVFLFLNDITPKLERRKYHELCLQLNSTTGIYETRDVSAEACADMTSSVFLDSKHVERFHQENAIAGKTYETNEAFIGNELEEDLCGTCSNDTALGTCEASADGRFEKAIVKEAECGNCISPYGDLQATENDNELLHINLRPNKVVQSIEIVNVIGLQNSDVPAFIMYARQENNDTVAFGQNFRGLLGQEITEPPLTKYPPTKFQFAEGKTATKVHCLLGTTRFHNGACCAIMDDQTVQCWGTNYRGGLGRGHTDSTYTPSGQYGYVAAYSPIPETALLPEGVKVKSLRGTINFCATTENGKVYCWGENVDYWGGRACYSGPQIQSTPTELNLPYHVIEVANAADALRVVLVTHEDGRNRIYAWGSDTPASSELGRDNRCINQRVEISAFTDFPTDKNPVDIVTVGYRMSMYIYILMDDGTLYRTDHRNELDKIYHVAMPNNEKVVQLTEDSQFHACVLLESGSVACMPQEGGFLRSGNAQGQLGIGHTSIVDGHIPYLVHLQGKKAKQIRINRYQTCAVIDDSDVVYGNNIYCWGDNSAGVFTDAETTQVSTPTRVNDFTSPFITYTKGIEEAHFELLMGLELDNTFGNWLFYPKSTTGNNRRSWEISTPQGNVADPFYRYTLSSLIDHDDTIYWQPYGSDANAEQLSCTVSVNAHDGFYLKCNVNDASAYTPGTYVVRNFDSSLIGGKVVKFDKSSCSGTWNARRWVGPIFQKSKCAADKWTSYYSAGACESTFEPKDLTYLCKSKGLPYPCLDVAKYLCSNLEGCEGVTEENGKFYYGDVSVPAREKRFASEADLTKVFYDSLNTTENETCRSLKNTVGVADYDYTKLNNPNINIENMTVESFNVVAKQSRGDAQECQFKGQMIEKANDVFICKSTSEWIKIS